jgi:ATP-dependent exoDNAse (exonuclease V) beta subunit
VPFAGRSATLIAGHIDFLQVRNDAVYILDYKPDARAALALSVRLSNLEL